MSDQLTFGFDRSAPDGETRKAQGVKRVLEHSDDWKEQAVALIKRLAGIKSEFTSDDVHEMADETGLPDPHHPNGWGAVMNKAAIEGVIYPTGRFVKSKRTEAHARVVGVWRSNR